MSYIKKFMECIKSFFDDMAQWINDFLFVEEKVYVEEKQTKAAKTKTVSTTKKKTEGKAATKAKPARDASGRFTKKQKTTTTTK